MSFGIGQAVQAAAQTASTAMQIREENKIADNANNTAKSLAGSFEPAAEEANSDLTSYSNMGQNAANSLAGGLSQSQLEATPGYQWNLAQGEQGVTNSAAARGLADSGAALKGAASYASGLADSTYQNQYNDALQTANLGLNASNQEGQNTINANNNSVQTRMAGVGAQMSGMSAMTNSLSNGLTALGNQAGSYSTNYAAYQNLLKNKS